MTPPFFTTAEVERMLTLTDQFLSDWADDAVQSGKPDPDYEQRKAEWEVMRPILALTPALLIAVLSGASKSWVADAGHTSDIEALRRIALEQAGWWNKLAWPALQGAGVTEAMLPGRVV